MDREIEILAYMPITQHVISIDTRELEEVFGILIDELKKQGYEVVGEENNMIFLENIAWETITEPAEYVFVKHFDLIDEHNRIDMRILFFEDRGRKRLGVCMASLNAKWVPKELNPSMIVLINDSVPKNEFEHIQGILEPVIWLIPGDDILRQRDIIRWPGDVIDAYKSGFLGLVIEITLIQMLKSQLIQHIISKAIKGKGPKDKHVSLLWTINSFFDIKLKEIVNIISKNRTHDYKIMCVNEFLDRKWVDASRESSIVNLIVSEAQVRINKYILWLTVIVVVFGVLSLLLQLGLIQHLLN